jgi:hypothetical protein
VKSYIVFRLILNALTGEPLDIAKQPPEFPAAYQSFDDCNKALVDHGPVTPKDGRATVYTCAVEKEISTI